MFESMTKHDLEQRLRQACAAAGVRYEVTISTEVAREMLRQAAADGAAAVVEVVLARAKLERREGRITVAEAIAASVGWSAPDPALSSSVAEFGTADQASASAPQEAVSGAADRFTPEPIARRKTQTHKLKTDPEVFEAVRRGDKTFEIRLDDRGFGIGDRLELHETAYTGEEMRAGQPLLYTGRAEVREVSHVLSGYCLQDGWCCLSFRSAARALGSA